MYLLVNNSLNIPLKNGITLGRKGADYVWEDAKMSAIHARIEETAEGQWLLVDQGSRNGLFINGEQVRQIELKPGVEFTIGRSRVQVMVADQIEPNPAPRQPTAPLPKNKDSSADLVKLLSKWQKRQRQPEVSIMPFFRTIRLNCVRGLQLGASWELGYGPRTAGRATPDILLKSPQCPDVAFELVPLENDILLVTQYPDQLSVNQVHDTNHRIQNGDVIEISDLALEVEFV